MRILYIHQYFCTRQGRSGTRSYEFARHLVRSGHRVTMLTSTFDLSDLKVPAGKRLHRFEVDGIEVVALRVGYSQSMGKLRRILSFLQFMGLSTWMACRAKGHDLVFATSTPLTVGVPGMLASLFLRIPLVFEVRDLWPAAPIGMGVLRNQIMIAGLHWLERLIYKRSARIIALSPGMRAGILRTGVPSERVELIPNCSDLDLFKAGATDKASLAPFGVSEHFIAIHAGSMGRVNALETVLDAAEQALEHGWDDVRFVLLGEGSEGVSLKNAAQEKGLHNIIFVGGVPRARVAAFLAASDVSLILVRDVPILEIASPNKFFDALAAGRPVIVNTGGWMRDMVEQHGIGLVAEPGSGSSLAAQVGILRENSALRIAMGERARRLAETAFDRRKLAVRFEVCLLRAAGMEDAAAELESSAGLEPTACAAPEVVSGRSSTPGATAMLEDAEPHPTPDGRTESTAGHGAEDAVAVNSPPPSVAVRWTSE